MIEILNDNYEPWQYEIFVIDGEDIKYSYEGELCDNLWEGIKRYYNE
jgi:hypothetical protein